MIRSTELCPKCFTTDVLTGPVELSTDGATVSRCGACCAVGCRITWEDRWNLSGRTVSSNGREKTRCDKCEKSMSYFGSDTCRACRAEIEAMTNAF